MKGINFPLYKTKVEGLNQSFDLTDRASRQKYFTAKAGFEIEKINRFLQNNTFVAYLMGKKNSGKGTFTKMFMEIFGEERIAHISVGDIVRATNTLIENGESAKQLRDYLERNYRGYISLDEAINALLGRTQGQLLPTEFILTLVKYEVDKNEGKSIFIDGFPRNLDQVSYSLFFRELINHRHDPDFFVLLDVPMSILDERIKYRVVCPKCQTSRNYKLHVSGEVGFDQEKKEFYLKCENPECNGERMVSKEGDELGIEAIRDRLETDEALIKKAFALYGIPKILLRNSIPVDKAKELVDDYELTPQYFFVRDKKTGKVNVLEKPWTVKDDEGVESFSLLPPPVVLSLIHQMADIL